MSKKIMRKNLNLDTIVTKNHQIQRNCLTHRITLYMALFSHARRIFAKLLKEHSRNVISKKYTKFMSNC